MFNNKKGMGTFWGTIIGASVGVFIGSQMSPMNRKKTVRKAKKLADNVKDGLDFW